MATLLLFNIEDEAKRTAIRLLSFRLGYTFRDIPPDRQNMKIADLLDGTEASVHPLTPFTDEMMVMSGFRSQELHELLDAMRTNGCPVKLKCVVTETNRSWTAVRLHQELAAEDQAMRRRASKNHNRDGE